MNKILEEDIQNLANNFKFKKEIANKAILVTGATGLLGSLIVRLLEELNKKDHLNIKIYAMARSKTKIMALRFSADVIHVVQELTDDIAIKGKVDYIIHTACPTNSAYMVNNAVELIEDTFIGTDNLLRFARRVNCQGFLYLSSLEIYGVNHNNRKIYEDDYQYLNHLKPRSSYPESKKLIECLCSSYYHQYKVPVYIARLTQTFGAGVSLHDNRVFMQFAKSICENQDILLQTKGELCRNYLYTTDAVNALFYIMFNGKPGEAYNVANEANYISIIAMAKQLVKNYNPQIRIKVELNDQTPYSDVTKLQLATDKLRELGWKPQYDLARMYERLFAYYQLEKMNKK